MINIVFLLLIFFLMTATLKPPSPFAVDPPESRSILAAEANPTLYLAADGRTVYAGAEGDAAFEAIAAGLAALDGPLVVRADRALPAQAMAAVLGRLGRIGVPEIRLVVGVN